MSPFCWTPHFLIHCFLFLFLGRFNLLQKENLIKTGRNVSFCNTFTLLVVSWSWSIRRKTSRRLMEVTAERDSSLLISDHLNPLQLLFFFFFFGGRGGPDGLNLCWASPSVYSDLLLSRSVVLLFVHLLLSLDLWKAGAAESGSERPHRPVRRRWNIKSDDWSRSSCEL